MEEDGVSLLHVKLDLLLVVHSPHAVVHLVHAVLPLGVLVLVQVAGAEKDKEGTRYFDVIVSGRAVAI